MCDLHNSRSVKQRAQTPVFASPRGRIRSLGCGLEVIVGIIAYHDATFVHLTELRGKTGHSHGVYLREPAGVCAGVALAGGPGMRASSRDGWGRISMRTLSTRWGSPVRTV